MTTSTVLIDYGSGNLHSAEKALARAAGGPITVTDKPELVAKADRIVLPGVGAFAHCMDQLAARPGLIEAMVDVVCWPRAAWSSASATGSTGSAARSN